MKLIIFTYTGQMYLKLPFGIASPWRSSKLRESEKLERILRDSGGKHKRRQKGLNMAAGSF